MEAALCLPHAAPVVNDRPAEGATAALTRGLRAGDEKAWEEFAAAYLDRLFRYLLVLNRGDEAAARDQLQETLLRVARHAKVLDAEAALWGWLTRLARSAHADASRRQGRYVAFLRRWFAEPATAREERDDPLPELLAASLAELGEGERDLVARKYFSNQSVREIAAADGCSEKAVESRLTRVRVRLRMLVLGRLKE